MRKCSPSPTLRSSTWSPRWLVEVNETTGREAPASHPEIPTTVRPVRPTDERTSNGRANLLMSRATSAALEESLWGTAEKSREPGKFQVSRGRVPSSATRRGSAEASPSHRKPVPSMQQRAAVIVHGTTKYRG
jgi:hypothetical protein